MRVGDRSITGLVKTFGERPPGDLIVTIASDNDLEIAVVNGNAAKELGLAAGVLVEAVELHGEATGQG